jgi:hypothetical protein
MRTRRFILGIVLCVLVALWLAPLVPRPGGPFVSFVLAWIVAVVLAVLLLVSLITDPIV